MKEDTFAQAKKVFSIRTIPIALFLLVVGVLIYFINCKAFMINDDVLYALAQECVGVKQVPLPSFLTFLPFDSISLPVARIADYRVSSFSMLLQGWLVSPWCDNIRLGNYMARLVIFLGNGRAVFDVVNTLIGLCVVVIFSALAFRKVTFPTLSLTLFVFLLCCPGLEPTCLWLDGSTNYLWGGCWLGLFLLCVYRLRHTKEVKAPLLLFSCAIAIICGIQHEALSAPLVGMMSVLFLLEKNRRRVWFLLILSTLSTMLPYLTSPGNIARMKNASGALTPDSLFSSLEQLLEVLVAPATLLFCAVCMQYRSNEWKKIICDHLPLFLFAGVSLLLLVYSIRGATWGVAGPAFYPCMGLMLCILIVLKRVPERRLRVLALPCALFSLGIMASFACVMAQDAKIKDDIMEKLRCGDKVVVVDAYADKKLPPTWHMYEIPKIVHDSWKWPMVKTVYNINADMEMPELLFNRLMPSRESYASFACESGDKPAVSVRGEMVTVRLPLGVKKARNIKVSIADEGRESDLKVMTPGTLATLPREIVRACTDSEKTCQQCEDYHEGFYYVNLRLPVGSELGVMRFETENNSIRRHWVITKHGVKSDEAEVGNAAR